MRTNQRKRDVADNGIKRKRNVWSPWKCFTGTAAIRTDGRGCVKIAMLSPRTVKGIMKNADGINPYPNLIQRPTNGVIVARVSKNMLNTIVVPAPKTGCVPIVRRVKPNRRRRNNK